MPALLAALARLTALDTDTSRDPRLAILERVQELGSAEQAAALEPYLADTDPRVAAQAATDDRRLDGPQRLGRTAAAGRAEPKR